MEGINWTQVVVALVVGLLIPAYKAWRAGKINAFLVNTIEGLAGPQDKKVIRENATSAGLEEALNAIVKKAGLAKNSGPLPPTVG